MADPDIPRIRQPDGTDDLGAGLMLLALALMERAPQWTHVAPAQGAVKLALLAIFWTIARYGIRAIRARLIYRRSGYVRFPQRPWALASGMICGLLLVVILGACMARMGTGILHAPLSTGLLLSLLLPVVAMFKRNRPSIAYASLSTAIAIGIQLWHPDIVAGSSWYCLLMGIVFLAGGAITLFLFVRQTPIANLEVNCP